MSAAQWLRNLRDIARNNLVLANALLDSQPTGCSISVDMDLSNDLFPKPAIQSGLVQLEIEEILFGRTISAIKEYRTRTGFGLKESKEAVDAWILKMGKDKIVTSPWYIPNAYSR